MATPILEDILQLSVSERIRLVEQIWDTITDAPEQLPVTEAQREELDRRLEAYNEDPEAGSSWQQLKANMKGNNGR